LKDALFYRGNGCQECGKTGYRGRIAIFELLTMNDRLREVVFEGHPSSVLKRIAREEGMRSLREDGFRKILSGITTVAEAIRVTQQDVT